MMSSNNTTKNPVSKDQTQISGGRKEPSAAGKPAQEQSLKCPRCDSPNTKFCYYNNYSLTQPRHFCKTCRRYWTKGGALRNVPIGGGCRKNKKLLKSSSSSSYPKDSGDSSGDSGGFKFFNGLSPAMDFQLGGLNLTNPSPDLMQTRGYNYNYNNTGNSSSVLAFDPSASGSSAPLMGFNFGGSLNVHNTNNNNLASSIESLSSINQDLHWKLQQQRLAVLFGGQENQRKTGGNSVVFENRKPQPILFENLEISKQGCISEGGNSRTEWFFDNNNNVSFAPVNPTAMTPANSSSTGNEMNGSSWSTDFQAWSTRTTNLNQYSALP